jgi:ABC-type sugar transport system permease subunit
VRGRGERVLWLYAAPALALVALVNVAPIAQTLVLAGSFGRLPRDPSLRRALASTLVFTGASVTLELLLGLALALLLSRRFFGRGAARAAALVPWALPAAVMALAWRWIFNSQHGVLGDLLFRAHLTASPQVAWLSSPGWAMAACVLADVWKTTPFMAVLLMSGLAGIPSELYEAAGVDGAGPVRRFFLITLPLLRPTMALALVFRAVQAFGVFDIVWVLTGGGPGGRTRMIALYVYDTVFRYLELGYGCALTLVMAGALAGLAAAILLLARPRRA